MGHPKSRTGFKQGRTQSILPQGAGLEKEDGRNKE
jgi:hypothetical protein